MSSSFLRLAAAALAAGASATVGAADYFFTPQVDAGVEHHTDRDLLPKGVVSPLKQNVTGYFVNASGIAGVRTPRGSTEVRPRIQYENFPDRSDLDEVSAFLDLRSRYTSQRSRWDVNARVRRQDRRDAELVGAGSDDFDPDNPVLDSGGRISVQKERVTDWQFRPAYRRALTQRWGILGEGLYQAASFEGGGGSDFDSWRLGGGFSWQARERTQLEMAAYLADYETDNGSNHTQATGLLGALSHRWSPTLSAELTLAAERTQVDLAGGPEDKSNNLAASVGFVREGLVSRWQLDAGRTFSPSSYGSRSTIDQVRVQMRRELSPRMRFTAAVRGVRQRAQGSNVSDDDDRDYARAEFDLRWAATRTIFVSGGYSYTWQEYTDDPGPGKNSTFVMRIGYAGLPPQR